MTERRAGTILGHLLPIQHWASDILYDNSNSGSSSTNVQDALDELLTGNIDGGASASVYLVSQVLNCGGA